MHLDELRTRLRRRACTRWLWVAFDPISKLIPVLHLDARTQHAAHALVHDLQQQLAPPCISVFTSDGLNHYVYALTAHFGQWVAGSKQQARQWQVDMGMIYGQVKQCYQRRRLVHVLHRMCSGTRQELRATLQGVSLSGTLNTAFVERVNLTLRQSIAARARRT